jgi:hypothetical protein
MDLGTITQRLRQQPKSYYRGEGGHERFAMDVRLVWHNCKVFNERGSEIWEAADRMAVMFEKLFALWVVRTEERERERHYREDVGGDEDEGDGEEEEEDEDGEGEHGQQERAEREKEDASLQLRPRPRPRPPPQWRWPLVGQWVKVFSPAPPRSQALGSSKAGPSTSLGVSGAAHSKEEVASKLCFVDASDSKPIEGTATGSAVAAGGEADASASIVTLNANVRVEVWVEVLAVDVEGRRVLVLHDNLAHEWVWLDDDVALEVAMYKRQELQEQQELQEWEHDRDEARELHAEQQEREGLERQAKLDAKDAKAAKAKTKGRGAKGKQSAKEAKGAKAKRGKKDPAPSVKGKAGKARQWRVGERAEVNYFESGRYYPGRIDAATRGSDGEWMYTVDYDDGDKETDVQSDMLRPVSDAEDDEKAEKARLRELRLQQRKKDEGGDQELESGGGSGGTRGKSKHNKSSGGERKRKRRGS